MPDCTTSNQGSSRPPVGGDDYVKLVEENASLRAELESEKAKASIAYGLAAEWQGYNCKAVVSLFDLQDQLEEAKSMKFTSITDVKKIKEVAVAFAERDRFRAQLEEAKKDTERLCAYEQMIRTGGDINIQMSDDGKWSVTKYDKDKEMLHFLCLHLTFRQAIDAAVKEGKGDDSIDR